MHAEILIN